MRSEFSSVADLPANFWRWPHINPKTEWACRKTGSLVVDTEFLDGLEKLRGMFGRPLIITSGYRSPEHNREVSTTGDDGPHTTGRAVDIRIYGSLAFELVSLAFGLGYTGIGLAQKGEHAKRFVHLDTLTAPEHPRPMIWTY